MIRLVPQVDLSIHCVNCSVDFPAKDWHIGGMHNMCEGNCPKCGRKLYQEIPVNAALFYPGTLDEAGERADALPVNNWYLNGLVEGFKKRNANPVDFEVKKFREFSREKVAILNTIDQTFGHTLFELFNASYYIKRQDVDLVILVQKEFAWMVPDGAAQVWIAGVSFGKANDWNDWLAQRIKQQLAGQNNVFLCRSFVQADSLDYDIEDYTRIKPFPLDEWDDRIRQHGPVITFIWRHDRFWKKVLPRWVDNFITRKLFPGILKKLRKHFQFRWILKFSRKLRKAMPTVDFAIAGMDDPDPKLPDWIKDYRYPKHSDEMMRTVCQRYADSHLVMGCNGSSLILPCCHAGAMINIVPQDAWAVSEGSFAFRINSFGDAEYRYVMLPPEVSIKRLINVSISILRDRSLVLLHTTDPWRNHDIQLDPYEWSRFRLKAFEMGKYFNGSEHGVVTRPREIKAKQ